jgi:hypothetical protein
MIIHDCVQGSERWHRLRLGIPTASCFSKIVTPGGKLSKQSDAYLRRLLAEWLYGAPLEDPESTYRSEWMQRGHDLEESAVHAYEFQTGHTAEKVGFVTDDDGKLGCSPDRLIGETGLLEIKVPAPPTHVGYMLTGSIEQEYTPQLQGQLLLTGGHRILLPAISVGHHSSDPRRPLSDGPRRGVERIRAELAGRARQAHHEIRRYSAAGC